MADAPLAHHEPLEVIELGRPRLSHITPEGEEVVRPTLTPEQRHLRALAQLPLADLLLRMTADPHRPAARHVLEFWVCLNDLPMHERHPSLRAPVYARLLPVLVRQCAYDADDGDEGGDGGDDERRDFRRGEGK